MSIECSVEVGREKLSFNTGYLAKQADGAVAVSYGEVVVFASAVASREVKEGQDFFPLTVDYREKFYAAGKIPGGFIKRESRPSDKEVLTSRLTDRPIRPLFSKDFISEVQIIIYVLSADQKNQHDIFAINAASAALSISGIPFKGPVGAVRVGRLGGQWIVNPTFAESEESDIDLVVAGTKKAVTMIEGSSKNVTEDDMIAAVEFAHRQIIKICETQEELAKSVNKPPVEYDPFIIDEKLKDEIKNRYLTKIDQLSKYRIKHERENAKNAIMDTAKQELAEMFPETIGQAAGIIDELDGSFVRARILERGERADGRGMSDIRPIDIMVGILPRAHGSAVFTRGETQSLGITTLGSVDDVQRMDDIEGEGEKHFMLHYHFPPFSVGETGRHGGVGRREIGHGILAERALEYVIPHEDDFPYTIRQVSEILESNGSSSMASVCSASLSLFNAGVPLKAAVAGIAMGLVMEDDRHAVLSDIIGLEDHLGDMDFKVAGTEEGITAFQMDIKIQGITPEIMRSALEQAKQGRLHILGIMKQILPQPEKQLSPYAPKMKTIKINPEKIGAVIGPGGKVIRQIIDETGADINVEDDGTVTLTGPTQESVERAEQYIMGLTEEVEINRIYEGTVKRLFEFGAMVEILPGKEGLIHISKLDTKRVNKVIDVVKIGDRVKVKVIKIDDKGRIDLSRKDAI
ncbi:MAG: polyribonucleotide nucleotidyltransferase [Spirochaetes bacterium RBG_13_51_14]|nr:MAG: polyribonucleotide nucleotidyltransferase [Spirochaetes bacterium RBG_13_51_14]